MNFRAVSPQPKQQDGRAGHDAGSQKVPNLHSTQDLEQYNKEQLELLQTDLTQQAQQSAADSQAAAAAVAPKSGHKPGTGGLAGLLSSWGATSSHPPNRAAAAAANGESSAQAQPAAQSQPEGAAAPQLHDGLGSLLHDITEQLQMERSLKVPYSLIPRNHGVALVLALVHDPYTMERLVQLLPQEK